jgi:hypothetical protein
MSKDLSDKFEQAVENDSRASSLERIETHSCASDNFDGVQYNLFGHYVPIRPIIDVVAETEGVAIEHMGHTNDGDHICLGIFVADLPEDPHPAFV